MGAGAVQEWDYTLLTVADPLTGLLDLAETVRLRPVAAFAEDFPSGKFREWKLLAFTCPSIAVNVSEMFCPTTSLAPQPQCYRRRTGCGNPPPIGYLPS